MENRTGKSMQSQPKNKPNRKQHGKATEQAAYPAAAEDPRGAYAGIQPKHPQITRTSC